jgi:hypothetical protein
MRNGYKMQIAKNLSLSTIHKFKVKIPLKSSCLPMYFIICGCMLEITLNRDWTEESVAMLRPRCESLLIRLTKISKLLCKAFKNCSSSSSFSPFWYAWKILNYYLWNFKTKSNSQTCFNLYYVILILFPFTVHIISIKPVLSNHLSYVTIFHCSLGRSHKTDLTVYYCSGDILSQYLYMIWLPL